MDQKPSSLLGAALDLAINRSHDWTPDGRYEPLSERDREARLAALPGHSTGAERADALGRVNELLRRTELFGDLFHRRDPIGELFLGLDPRGPARLRAEYPEVAEGFTDDELRRAFWEGVMRTRK
jgi:hypothetical protein